jgi:hypothetical protein
MGTSWLQWIILSRLTGSPVGSALALLIIWYAVDRFTIGLMPSPLRWISKWRYRQRLEKAILANPHDRRARLELAQLEVERGRGKRAMELLRPTFDAGADDIQSVFTMGQACLLEGHLSQGEKLLAHAEDMDPDFRLGEIHLVLGRARLKAKDYAGAQRALSTLVKLRTGTVEGRVLLAQAYAGAGDDVTALAHQDAAWHEYVVAPRFKRRQERLWAWRARPMRPLLYGTLLIAAAALLISVAAPALNAWAHSQAADGSYTDPNLVDPDDE